MITDAIPDIVGPETLVDAFTIAWNTHSTSA